MVSRDRVAQMIKDNLTEALIGRNYGPPTEEQVRGALEKALGPGLGPSQGPGVCNVVVHEEDADTKLIREVMEEEQTVFHVTMTVQVPTPVHRISFIVEPESPTPDNKETGASIGSAPGDESGILNKCLVSK
jgi:hypothetical protein